MNRNLYSKKDKVYLNKKAKTKEYFKLITEYLYKYKSEVSLLDVACASGDFLSLFKKKKNFNLTGIDFSKTLINLAKKKVPNATFNVMDLSKKIKLKEKFDICTCLGTLSVFDDKFKIINKLINLVKKKGELFFFDPINENDVNVIIRYQNNYEKNHQWLTGFNTFSKKYWEKKLKQHPKIKSFSFQKFNIRTTISKNKKNPMRAWTIPFNNKNQLTVGTGQLLNFYIIKINLK
tara:strand:- start:2426 stop:3127 length:702 start_codon:yes stop_codon:yes gene_type:complete